MFTQLYRQSISCILSAALLGNTLYAGGIVVDTAAAASHQATMDTTSNGIPLINIVTPNAGGLSHNKFSEFNIEQKGVIFNNATSAALTQLGGWVQGNAALGTTPARVILNEVTGTNRSLLSGYGEVAGHSADLIIANPNGITMNGGGFINTPRATLTTGTPIINGATLDGFHVQRGDILIEGSGVNAENIDRVDFYTKALQLNAQIHAKKLDVVTGEHTIGLDGTVTSDNVVGSETFSIDSSALGGIYADTIRLIGTDKGVGINLPPITYASNSLTLGADGQIVVASAISGNTVQSQSGSLTINQLLYAANSIDLSASGTIHNTPDALILSHGNINIHDTGTLLNDAARIEASGDLSIQAGAIENLSNIAPTVVTNHVSRYVASMVVRDTFDWDALYTEKWLDTIDRTGYKPSYLLSGQDIFLDGLIHNRYSLIASDRDMYLSGSLNNEASIDAHDIIETQYYYDREHQSCGWSGCHWHNDSFWGGLSHTDTITDHVYSSISAGRNLYGNLISVNNTDVTQGSNFSSMGVADSSYVQNLTTGTISYTLPNGGNGEFVLSTNPSHNYLIESNPLFTDFNTFISSDYIMSRLHLDVAANTKRLGDARYETQLVRDAVFRLTGERYLAGFGSDTAQYQALMDNALAVSSDLNLEFGVKLSASQVAALNRDIVWMEDQVVSGQHVLVPVVYLASLKNQELTPGGKIVAGNDMQLAVAQGLNNAGEIRAGGTLLAQADTITNTGGTIKSSSDMLLHTTNDITNTSGKISGNNVALVSDNGNIVSQTALKTITLNQNGTTGTLGTVGESATIQSTGDMILSASKDIILTGAETTAGGNVALNGENVTLSALEQSSHYTNRTKNGSSEIESVKQNTSTLSAGGDVSINATKDVTLNSSTINGNNVALTAGENVNITAANDREFMDVQTHNKSTFNSSSKRDMTLKESVVSSSINGNNIAITSGKDTTLQAANLKATENIQVDAAGDINVLAKAYREASLHQESKSSLGGLSKSMSLDSTDAVKLHEATVKTEAKNIIMNSGKDINIIASEVNSAADVQLKAFENLNIVAGEEVKSEKHESQKSSFNLGGLITAVATSGLVTSGSVYTQDIHNKDNYDTTAKSSSIKAGGSITADTGTTNIVGSNLNAAGDVAIKADIGGINVASAQELHNASTLDKKVDVKLTNLIDSTIKGIEGLGSDTKLKVNVASATFDESTTSAQSVKNVASSITSGKNVTLDSSDDLTIKGSNVSAADTIDLKSKTGNIAITESVDTTNTNTKEKHASADVNLVVQNEFVEAAVAVDNAVKAAEQLKQTKEDYSNYKRQLKGLEASLDTLKKDPQVSETDIANLQGLIAATKDDEAYYLAAIAAATVNLASKSVAVAQQGEAAGASIPTAGFSAGLSLDMKGSQTTTDTTSTKSNASNLVASNINIATDKTADTSVTVSGSNVKASNTLNIDTHDLNVIASTDTASSNSSSKDISGSVSMTVYGAPSGPQVSLGYGQNESRSNSTTHTNSTLTGNTVNLNAANDATFKGATVSADDTLNVNVGNNLAVESVQDTSSSSNHGFNISGGFGMGGDTSYANTDIGLRTGNGKVESVNGGLGASNGRSYDTQTVLTSLSGDSVNVTTGKDTKLSGAVIAATDAQGNDTGKLNLSTNTLTTENLTDTHYNSQSGFSVGANIGLSQGVKDPKPDTQNKENKTTTTINSPRLAFNTSTDTSVGKTLATLGEGNIAISDTANSTDTTNLNRDVTKVDKELYSSSTGTKVDATLDTRMLTENGRKQIAEDVEKTKLLGEAISDVATKDSVSIIGDQANGQTGVMQHIENNVAYFDAMKQLSNSNAAKTFLNADATPEEKQQAYNTMVSLMSTQLGISAVDAKVMIDNKYAGAFVKDNTPNGTIFINDLAQNTSADTIKTLGHEVSHANDYQKDQGVDKTANYSANREEYANIMGDNALDYANFSFAENGYNSLNSIGNNNIGTNIFNGYGQSPAVTKNTENFNKNDPKSIDPLCINSNSCYGKTMEQKLNSGQQQVIGKLGNYIVSGISQGKGTTTDAIVLYDTKTKNTITMTQDEFFVYNQLAQTDMEKFNNLLAVAQMQSNTTHTAQNAVSGYNPDGQLSGIGDAWKQYVSSGEILLDVAGGSAGSIEKKIAGSVTKNTDNVIIKGNTVEDWGVGPLREPAQVLKKNEDVLIDTTYGLQTKQPNSEPFKDIILGKHGDAETTYLYTIDERGINIVLEKTPFPTPRGNVVHSNISSKASIGGEVWFGPNNTVTINAGSGRYGDRAGITAEQWESTAKLWESLGYKVNKIPFGER